MTKISVFDPRFRSIGPHEVPELACLLERIKATYAPVAIFLYGSRARGDAGPLSDWDLKILVPDTASEDLLSPMLGFEVQQGSGVFADVSCAYISEFEADFGIVNTAAYEMLLDGCVRIDLD